MEIPFTSLPAQEQDLQLFLEALGVTLPVHEDGDDEYIVIPLTPAVSSLFEANDDAAVVLTYRMRGKLFPLLLAFLKGVGEVDFCSTTLLLESYSQGIETASILRTAIEEFFPQEIDVLLDKLGLARTGPPLHGHLDFPIFWNIEPDISVVTDLLMQKLGKIDKIPLFPSVFYYNNIYDQNLLEAVLPELDGCQDILALGSGAGLEAICIALKYDMHVDATDINPIAIANTIAACRRTGTDKLVSAWVSDGFLAIEKSYDAILFEAPLATGEMHSRDPNRYDLGGKLLQEILRVLPFHLKPGGKMYLMSHPELTPYMPANGLQWRVLRYFAEHDHLAIHEIRMDPTVQTTILE